MAEMSWTICEGPVGPLTVVAGPKVYSSLRRRFSSLCFSTIKTPQSSAVSSEDAVMNAREVARAARQSIDVAHERLFRAAMNTDATKSLGGVHITRDVLAQINFVIDDGNSDWLVHDLLSVAVGHNRARYCVPSSGFRLLHEAIPESVPHRLR